MQRRAMICRAGNSCHLSLARLACLAVFSAWLLDGVVGLAIQAHGLQPSDHVTSAPPDATLPQFHRRREASALDIPVDRAPAQAGDLFNGVKTQKGRGMEVVQLHGHSTSNTQAHRLSRLGRRCDESRRPGGHSGEPNCERPQLARQPSRMGHGNLPGIGPRLRETHFCSAQIKSRNIKRNLRTARTRIDKGRAAS